MRQLTRREFLSLSSATAVSLCVLAGTSKAMVPPAAKPPPAGADEELFAQISAQAADLVQQYNLPGLSIGIIHNDQLVFAQGYGFQSGLPGGTRVPMTPQTVQSMASVSKSFAGTAIMQLVEAGLDQR